MAGPPVADADDERDRQATVTDFLDYTEHLPSDVERSLTLLAKQDELAQQSIEEIHRLLAQYSRLPPSNDAYESAQLRARISYLFDLTQRRRESAAAEAKRLYNEVQRQHKRLISVKAKLQALPRPPSRDPTPQPNAQKSPQSKRDGIRINLKVDRQKIQSALPRRPRYRKITVPGEVLSPGNVGTPTASDMEGWVEEEEEEVVVPPPAPPVIARKKDKERDRNREREKTRERGRERDRGERPPKDPSASIKDRPPKLPGQMGTNVHSAVAGISTSNALSLLTPPPEDARPGSKWAPWFRLTEYEMAKLRKRMKKNAIWAPSDTMIRRELVDSGRGHEAYQKAKQIAEETGESIVDDDDIEGQVAGNRPLRPGEISADVKAKTTNKGMSLNVQKKEKKAMMQQQQAALAAQQSADLAAQRLGSLGESFRTLFDRPGAPTTPTEATPTSSKGVKRKRESGTTPSALDLQLQAQLQPDTASAVSPAKAPPAKKQRPAPPTPKTTTTTTTITTTVPTAPPAPSPVKNQTVVKSDPAAGDEVPTVTQKETRKTSSSNTKRPSLMIRPPAQPPNLAPKPEPPSATLPARQSSRPTSRRASAGPADSAITRQSPRTRASATPGPTPTTAMHSHQMAVVTAASRRSKRPAPGQIYSGQEGGAMVSVGRRKTAPKSKGKAGAAKGEKPEEDAAEEEIDPNEPRYCICDEVSWGEMVCCDNPSCEREWFHFNCVGLTKAPPKNRKWWCPDCEPKEQRGRR